MVEGVVAPLLHNNEPVKFDAVSKELPQLFTTSIEGADGICFGAETPLAALLVQPLMV